MFLTIGPASGVRQRSRKHVGDTGNPSGKLLPVCAATMEWRERRRQRRRRRSPKGRAGKFVCPVKLRRRCRLLLPVRCRHGGSRLLATRSKRDTSRLQDVRPFTNRLVNLKACDATRCAISPTKHSLRHIPLPLPTHRSPGLGCFGSPCLNPPAEALKLCAALPGEQSKIPGSQSRRHPHGSK